MNTPSHLKPLIHRSVSVLRGFTAGITRLTELVRFNRQNDTINEVLFYGSENEEKKKEIGLNNLFCIYYVIIHASRTIDVCVPSLISETISKCLISVHKNNTKIRIALHSDDGNLNSFLECGIEVKLINSRVKLEHEFILIDALSDGQDAIAIIGALDYEVGRVNRNRDNTLLTSDAAVVLALKREFDRVWDSEYLKMADQKKI